MNFKRLWRFAALLPVALFAGCSQDSEQMDVLLAEKSALNIQYEEQLLMTRQAVSKSDSLQTIVHDLEQELAEALGNAPTYNASEADEQAIEALVNNLHRGWASMFKTKSTDDVLKYFLPKYTASAVRIDTENVPRVRRKNNSNFEEWLNELLATNDISLSFGETKFLYTEVKGDVFVTSYRTTLRVYENNKEMWKSSLVTQLAGEKRDDWMVGHYNWVSFNY